MARMTTRRGVRLGASRRLGGAIAAVAIGLGTLVVGVPTAYALTTVVQVGPGDIAPNGPWASPTGSDTGTLAFVAGPDTPPLGAGSLAMAVASTSEHRSLYNYLYGICATGPACTATGTSLSALSALGYSTYRAGTSSTAGVVPSFNIEIDPDGTTALGVDYATLVWEPASNGGGVLDDTWQTWDVDGGGAGVFSSTADLTGYGVLECPASTCTATWSQITTALGSGIVKYGLGPNAGSGWSGFSGNVDALVVGIGANETQYDFEEAPTVSIGDASVAEGDGGTRTVRLMVTLDRAAPGSGVTVGYATSAGTATAGSDYKAKTGSLYFKPAQTTRYVNVMIKPDTVAEGDETLAVALSAPVGATLADGSGSITIIDDEANSGALLRIGDAMVHEGDSGPSRYVFLSVTLDQPQAGTVTVGYATGGGTATAPLDYAGRTGTLTFNPGVRAKYVLVYLYGDTASEGSETFDVTLSTPVGATIADGTGTVTITDDD